MSDSSARNRLGLTIGAAIAASLAVVVYRTLRSGSADGQPPVERWITIGRESGELHERWLDVLPRAMSPFADVQVGPDTLRWTLTAPPRTTFETTLQRSAPGNTLRWTNADPHGARFDGAVEFRPAPRGQGSEVALRLDSQLLRPAVGIALAGALRRFKSVIETGELPSLERNPSGRSAGSHGEK